MKGSCSPDSYVAISPLESSSQDVENKEKEAEETGKDVEDVEEEVLNVRKIIVQMYTPKQRIPFSSISEL